MLIGDAANNRSKQMLLFFAGAGLIAMAGAIFDATFSNYLNHRFGIDAGQRGALEFPREFPGLAITLVTGALLFLPEVRVAAVAAAVAAIGMLGLALWVPHDNAVIEVLGLTVQVRPYTVMIIWMILFSTGTHLLMPIQSAIAVGLAKPGERGKRLGQLGMATTSAAFLACGLGWLLLRKQQAGFHITFTAGVILAGLGCVVFLFMRPHLPHNPDRPKLVFRRRFWLFYVLCALFGARKQIFLTFGYWLLVKDFGTKASTIFLLLFIARGIGIGFKPLVGRLIDRVGPRLILALDALSLIVVCLGYGLASVHPGNHIAVAVVYQCYVLDDLFFAAGMARTVYVVRLTSDHHEVVGTLAAGVSINHAVSMTVPFFGGLLWNAYGPMPVFMVAAGLMVVTFVCTLFVRAPAKPAPAAEVGFPSPAAAENGSDVT